jgi:bifunctional UDP-N-acetylglucosamine pyrophosphorylase/glucosamine-1-phosphate N-acetyltransferase
MSNSLTAVILAGGAGTRMKSKKSKILHRLAGRALLQYPVLASVGAGANRIVVVASPSNIDDVRSCLEEIRETCAPATLEVVEQPVPRGSGDAAKAALPALTSGSVMVVNGDAPLLEASHLRALVDGTRAAETDLGMLTCELADPFGYGRIVRDGSGRVVAVREQKDLAAGQESILEVNAGIYCASAEFFKEHLPALQNDNAQKEYYITDLIEAAAKRRGATAVSADPVALQGVNDRVQLHAMEQLLFERITNRHRRAGATIGAGVSIDDQVKLGSDTAIAAGVSLRGNTVIGSNVVVDSGSVLTDSVVEDGALIKPYCVIDHSTVGAGAQVGPFAHLRPHSELGAESRVGNFVEIKASSLGRGAKVNHLSYIGDGEIGEGSNIGAGTIFCNYDGFSKAKTIVGKNVFVGSDSQLVAPVTIGDGSFVGTGTTVTENVPEHSLVLSRGRQVTRDGYAHTLRAKLQSRAESKKRAK